MNDVSDTLERLFHAGGRFSVDDEYDSGSIFIYRWLKLLQRERNSHFCQQQFHLRIKSILIAYSALRIVTHRSRREKMKKDDD